MIVSDYFQLPLSSVTKIDLAEKKGNLTLAVTSFAEGKICLRSASAIKDWIAAINVKGHIIFSSFIGSIF